MAVPCMRNTTAMHIRSASISTQAGTWIRSLPISPQAGTAALPSCFFRLTQPVLICRPKHPLRHWRPVTTRNLIESPTLRRISVAAVSTTGIFFPLSPSIGSAPRPRPPRSSFRLPRPTPPIASRSNSLRTRQDSPPVRFTPSPWYCPKARIKIAAASTSTLQAMSCRWPPVPTRPTASISSVYRLA